MDKVVVIDNTHFLHENGRRTAICLDCGNLINTRNIRCTCGGSNLYVMTYEHTCAASLIKDKARRLVWWESGHAITYHAGRRKFRPTINGKEVK